MTNSNQRRPARTQLPDEVASYLREQIMTGRLRAGDFLRMEPVAEAVGVSITPVREALLALSSEGFVTAVPRRGFMVATFTKQDVHDLFWAQSRLSGKLAARAAKRITGRELDELGAVMRDYDTAVERGDADEIGQLGHPFHRLINRAAGSDRLALLLAAMVKHLPNHFYASFEAHAKTAIPHHHEIYDALRAGDAKHARKITRLHIMDGADRVIEDLEQRGLWAPAPERDESTA